MVVQEDVCNGCGYCVPGLPVRRDRPARGRRPRLEVHALLRPPQGRQGARLRAGVPDQLDPVRRAVASCASAPSTGSRTCRRPGRTRRSCTSPTTMTASAARGRSSCCSTSPRSTACRPTRSTPVATWARSGRPPAAAALRSGAGLAAAVFGGRRVSSTEPRSYHGQPVIKQPTWTWEIPMYFFTGGLAGASAGLAYLSRAARQRRAGAAGLGSARSRASRSARRC